MSTSRVSSKANAASQPTLPLRRSLSHRLRPGFGLLALAGWAILATPSRADGTLTLELPPSPAAQEAQRRSKPPNAHTSVVPKASRRAASLSGRRGRYPARGGKAERVVGRLGQLDQATRIHRAPRRGSQLLISAPAGTYVAIQQESGAWVGVLMADGSTGWLRGENVRLLDYQVVSNGNAMMPSGGGDIYPSSSVPVLTTDPQAILNEAYKYMGVRYVWGGNGYGGIDCSGFVKNVFAANGYRLPRTATEQMSYGVPVPADQLQAGDRLYFGHKKSGYGVTHTGIYIGNGYFIHSSSSRKGVAVSRLDEPMYARIYVCARR